jgi:malonate-semialdehyde dehydrogenase (acetylating)/methylmalonate-semialdehyde dehydrogenase
MQKTRREGRNFVGDRWEQQNGRKTEPVYDPATGEVIAERPPLSTAKAVDRAVKAAQAAFSSWAATSPRTRSR